MEAIAILVCIAIIVSSVFAAARSEALGLGMMALGLIGMPTVPYLIGLI